MLPDDVKTIVNRFVDEPWNQGKVDVIDELCDPDYTVRYGTDREPLGGRDFIKNAILENRAKIPDFQAKVTEMIIEGDRVAYEWMMSGTEDGAEFLNVGMTILHFRGGKIIDDRFIEDHVKAAQTTP